MLENNQQIKWKNYLRIFLQRKWLFFLPFFSVLSVTVIISFILPKVYSAKAKILIEEETMINPLLRNLAVSAPVSGKLHQLREEILSWPRLVQLVEELNLSKSKSSSREFEALMEGIRKKISVTMSEDDVVIISYSDHSPVIAQKVVNTISDIFIRKNLTSQAEESSSATDFIRDQLDIYKKKLETSEEAMRNFKETYGLQMPLAAQINTELARLEAELTTLLVDCTEEHPQVRELRANIKSLKEKRSQQIRLAAQNANVDPEKYIEIAESIPKQEQELARLTRDTLVNQNLYALLLERLETARISQQLENSENKTKFKIIEPARFPLKPISPNKTVMAFMGFVLGVCAGCGCIYLVEHYDQSFNEIDELMVSFNAPVLGAISRIASEESLYRPSIFTKARDSVIPGAKK